MQAEQLSLSRNYFIKKGLRVGHYAFDDATINTKLLEIQFYDKKTQQKTTAAGIMTGLGITMVIVSGAVISSNFNSTSSAAPLMFVTGVACSVGSIPLWIASCKPRKSRNRAIDEANALLMR
jgi:hypothetical protein